MLITSDEPIGVHANTIWSMSTIFFLAREFLVCLLVSNLDNATSTVSKGEGHRHVQTMVGEPLEIEPTDSLH